MIKMVYKLFIDKEFKTTSDISNNYAILSNSNIKFAGTANGPNN